MTLSIPTMLILTFRILCVDKIGSRAAAACINIITTIPTKISAPGRLQNADFPPPLLLVYGTHNEGRLGKNIDTFSNARQLRRDGPHVLPIKDVGRIKTETNL